MFYKKYKEKLYKRLYIKIVKNNNFQRNFTED